MENMTLLINKKDRKLYGLNDDIIDFKTIKNVILKKSLSELLNKNFNRNKAKGLPDISDEEIYSEIKASRLNA